MCRDSCQADNECNAFTYNHAHSVCFLKSAPNETANFLRFGNHRHQTEGDAVCHPGRATGCASPNAAPCCACRATGRANPNPAASFRRVTSRASPNAAPCCACRATGRANPNPAASFRRVTSRASPNATPCCACRATGRANPNPAASFRRVQQAEQAPTPPPAAPAAPPVEQTQTPPLPSAELQAEQAPTPPPAAPAAPPVLTPPKDEDGGQAPGADQIGQSKLWGTLEVTLDSYKANGKQVGVWLRFRNTSEKGEFYSITHAVSGDLPRGR